MELKTIAWVIVGSASTSWIIATMLVLLSIVFIYKTKYIFIKRLAIVQIIVSALPVVTYCVLRTIQYICEISWRGSDKLETLGAIICLISVSIGIVLYLYSKIKLIKTQEIIKVNIC